MMLRRRFVLLLLAGVVSIAAISQADETTPKRNVIVMISDGAGFSTFAAASMYRGKWDAGEGHCTEVFCGPEWKQFAVQTFPLTMSSKPRGTNEQDASLVLRSGEGVVIVRRVMIG